MTHSKEVSSSQDLDPIAMQKAFKEQTDLLELTAAMAKVGGWELDLSTMTVTWSKETGRIHEVDENYKAPQFDTGENWYPPEAWPTIKAAVLTAIQFGTPYDLESPFITAKGRHIWVRVQGFPIIEDGKTIKLRGTFQDITERKEVSLALAKSEQRLTLALEGAGDGLWDWNIQTNHVYYSPQWEKMFGFEPGTVTQSLDSITPRLHPEDSVALFAEVGRYLNHELPIYSHEARMVHKSGRIMHTLHRGTALFDQAGKAIRMLGTTVDITERKQTAIDLEKAMQSAQAAAIAKSEFLASMSHEIRTPLNGVLGLVQLLEDTALDSLQNDLVQTIKTTGDGLMLILNDILDLSKMENGKLLIEPRPFNPQNIVEEITKVMQAAAFAQDNRLQVEFKNEIPKYLISDAGRLRQILFNLVGNAIKFTQGGTITISLSWKENHFIASIQDTGIGIPVEKQSLVFKSFTQTDSSTARKFGGTGLGLAISKRLVELMGGEIGFESEAEKGSRFWISIPMETAALATDSKTLKSSLLKESAKLGFGSGTSFPQLRALVVEDNVVNQLVIKGMLKKLGCQIEMAKNGLEAVEMALKSEFDFILMDCHMPEMDGFEATKRIRQNEKDMAENLNTPAVHRKIIALTANAMLENEAHCKECGMDGFLAKPLKIETLQELLNQMI